MADFEGYKKLAEAQYAKAKAIANQTPEYWATIYRALDDENYTWLSLGRLPAVHRIDNTQIQSCSSTPVISASLPFLSPTTPPPVGSPTTPIESPTTPIKPPTTPIESPTTPIESPTTINTSHITSQPISQPSMSKNPSKVQKRKRSDKTGDTSYHKRRPVTRSQTAQSRSKCSHTISRAIA